ncbi:hypothetical protein [Tepidibacter hydrothermalis]|uniref:CopG family transcriptional regulator n=1 Tax=Tepidibacter hydrothermalis TaxID=3036126 RepID=A0ABY8EL96_9FIRM|nr:hypothetical protein [Tepidibacter hydrothermalis]WFD12210.1 hypothetical protein P4S50_09030 [Tepidibacter hydrothermalis]
MARKTKSADVETVESVEVMTFSKEKIISAKKYSNRKDILNELLEDGKEYSFDQVDTLMDDYMKGKVK